MNKQQLPRVLDRNGREIKPGDRVRIIADECNKFLHDRYGDTWIPEMHWEADLYGTATLNGFFQLADENGEMLWDLQWNGKEPELEVTEDES